jgi:hypothetical protein
MVVLARAAGIPARYAVGYLAEFYDETEGVYIVTADQAHAWPEIYFPGYGWVAFEPTGGRPAIDRPVEPIPQLPDEFEINFSPLVPENRLSFEHWPRFFGLSLIVVIIFTLVGIRVSDWWFGRLQPDTLVPKLYKRIYRYARWAGLSVKPGDTAYHFASDLNTYLTRLGEESYWADWALEGVGMISRMTEIFVHCMFNPLKEELESGEILRLYKQLRPRLWLLMLLGRAYPHRVIRPLIWRNAPLLISMPLEENK